MRNIEQHIIEILVDKFGIEKNQVTVNDELLNFGMDSIAIIELKFELLKKFELEQEDLNIYEDDSINVLLNKIGPLIEEKKYA